MPFLVSCSLIGYLCGSTMAASRYAYKIKITQNFLICLSRNLNKSFCFQDDFCSSKKWPLSSSIEFHSN